jgi:hypothetical protein
VPDPEPIALPIIFRKPQMQKDKQFRVSGDWALASDNVQWVIQRKQGSGWQAIKFIRSTKEHLAHRLKGLAPAADAERLLEGLPDTFEEWLKGGAKAPHEGLKERVL